MPARRFLFRWGWLGCVLGVAAVFAQDEPAAKPSVDDAAQEKQAGPAAPNSRPTPAPSGSTREFKPSEEVSPDQEVDFPADL